MSTLPGSPTPTQQNLNDVYDPTLYAKADAVSTLSDRVAELEKQFGSTEKIADTICRVSERDTKIQEMFATTFIKMLRTNDASKQAIEDLIEKTDGRNVSLFWKKFGAMLWAALGSLITLLITALVQMLPTLMQRPEGP